MGHLFNIAIFQLGWFTSVLSASWNVAWWSLIALMFLVPLHCRLVGVRFSADLQLAGVALMIGLLWDSLLLNTGVVVFDEPMLGVLVPYWMLALWVFFALTLNHSLGWMRGRYLLAAIFGGVGGALSYWAGHRLGALQLPNLVVALPVIAVGWALMTPLLFKLTDTITRRWIVTRSPHLVEGLE